MAGDASVLGRLHSLDGEGVVRMEDRLDAGIDDLWGALTDPDRLAHWFGEVEGELSQGASSVCASPSRESAQGRWRRASLRSACC
jgi:uncharacterized protein YndB with AHSA1/START domain